MRLCFQCEARFESAGEVGAHCPSCAAMPPRRQGFVAFAPELATQNDGFRPEGFAALAALEDRYFWFEARNRLLWWGLRRFFPAARSFLEIGCGTGFVLRGLHGAFPDLRLFGSEIYCEGLAFAQQRVPDVTLFQMDGRRMPFDREFDVLGAFDVLEHVEEDESVLDEMFRSVRPGGGVILTVPQHRFLWSAFDEYACHKRRYSRRELVEKLKAAGFELLDVTSYCAVLLSLMLLSRLRDRELHEDYDPVNEMKIGRFANGVLRSVLNVERVCIRGGIRFPWGGSLFVIGMRPDG